MSGLLLNPDVSCICLEALLFVEAPNCIGVSNKIPELLRGCFENPAWTGGIPVLQLFTRYILPGTIHRTGVALLLFSGRR